MTSTIIDVSAAQGLIDWPTLAASKRCDGAILKATEGNAFVDQTFAANWAGATACGLLLGTYHFAHPDQMADDAKHEAEHYVLSVAKHWDSETPLIFALDIEEARKVRAGAEFVAWCRAFVERVEDLTGFSCWVYTGGPFYSEHAGAVSDADAAFFAARPLWIAAYVNDARRYVAMTPWRFAGHTLHQWSGDVGPGNTPGIRYPGIAGNVVDTSRYDGSIESLRMRLARNRDTLPAPPPDDPITEPGTPRAKSTPRMQAVRPEEGVVLSEFLGSLANDTDPEPPKAA